MRCFGCQRLLESAHYEKSQRYQLKMVVILFGSSRAAINIDLTRINCETITKVFFLLLLYSRLQFAVLCSFFLFAVIVYALLFEPDV